MSLVLLQQRLRQGQARCQQQLLSLAQWHAQQQGSSAAAAASPGLQARGAAGDAGKAAVQFAKQRKGFQGSLGELRRQWAQERREKETAAATAAAAER